MLKAIPVILFGISFSLFGFSQSSFDNDFIQKKVESNAKVTKLLDGNILYDFQKDFFGRLKVDISKLSTGDSAIIFIGEKIESSGKIDRNPGGTIRSYKYRIIKGDQDYLYLPDLPDKRNTSGNALILPQSMGIVAPLDLSKWKIYQNQKK